MLTIQHDVRSNYYRSPTGPVPGGSFIRFRIGVEEEEEKLESVRLFYVYGLNPFREGFSRMEGERVGQAQLFSATIQMDLEPGLFFYWFEVRLTDGRYRWGFPDPASYGLWAETRVSSPDFQLDGSEAIPGFQVTVFEPAFRTPDWMKGAVQYQIFPDRYNRGSRFDESRALALMKWPERIWHSSWEGELDYEGKAPAGYQACDFYGGTLAGITEKLPQLASWGVTVLYLNPVFQSQSNHRYDTGDYLTVDPLLGSNGDLVDLFREARALGIRVILDGVFSHTGADSIYFNRYDRYDSIGAWQEMRDGTPSDYSSWFRFAGDKKVLDFTEEGRLICLDSEASPSDPLIAYECWWDFPSLPNVNEDDLSYRTFICGPEGVLAHWIRLGCAGFRLDVSDELPDSFLRLLRWRVKEEDPDALVLGEVWEEPTAKISYGHHRDFLFGRTHDTVMAYPFRGAVLAFLKNEIQGEELALSFDRMLSVTPKESLYAQMNLLGSHDTTRVITELAGPPCPASRPEQARLKLGDDERRRGEELVVTATLLQLAFPGALALYYGDEIGMEGYRDPFNRRTYPWQDGGSLDEKEMTGQITDLMRLKSRTPVLRTGNFEILYAKGPALLFRRSLDAQALDAFGKRQPGPREALITVNRDPCPAALSEEFGVQPLQGRGGALYLDGKVVFMT